MPWSGSSSSPNAKQTSPLYQRACGSKSAGWFEYDAKHDLLPQVSWLVAPSAQTEHPNWMPAAGAQYISLEAGCARVEPGSLGEDRLHPDLRRERRTVRPRPAERPARRGRQGSSSTGCRSGSDSACRRSWCRRGRRAATYAPTRSTTRRSSDFLERGSASSSRTSRPGVGDVRRPDVGVPVRRRHRPYPADPRLRYEATTASLRPRPAGGPTRTGADATDRQGCPCAEAAGTAETVADEPSLKPACRRAQPPRR